MSRIPSLGGAIDEDLAEQREYGFDHATVGSIVSNRWGLPEGLQTAIGLPAAALEELLGTPARRATYSSRRGTPLPHREPIGGELHAPGFVPRTTSGTMGSPPS